MRKTKSAYYEFAGQHLGYQYLSPGLRLFGIVPRLYTGSGIVWRSMLAAGLPGAALAFFPLYLADDDHAAARQVLRSGTNWRFCFCLQQALWVAGDGDHFAGTLFA